MGDPYYAPKEEPNEAKDSAQLRKLEERDKRIKYAKKLGKPMHSSKGKRTIFMQPRSITQRSSRLKLWRGKRMRELK